MIEEKLARVFTVATYVIHTSMLIYICFIYICTAIEDCFWSVVLLKSKCHLSI